VNILVVDDDPEICQFLHLVLTQEGANVTTAGDGKQALRAFYAGRPDLVILDIMMPEMDGYETCRRLRDLSDVPIIMLTALGQADAIVKGLGCGADDYVTKPFELAVLRARIEALLRRSALRKPAEEESALYKDQHLVIDTAQHSVLVKGERVALSPTEYQLLAVLVRHAGQLLTYSQLLQQVWGWEYKEQTDYLHVYMSRLRHKLEPDPQAPRYLLTEQRMGYRFMPQQPNRQASPH
jgi:two-component system, OmpR family, KDP operon response regulator KdpE